MKKYKEAMDRRSRAQDRAQIANRLMNKLIDLGRAHTKRYKDARKRYQKWSNEANRLAVVAESWSKKAEKVPVD